MSIKSNKLLKSVLCFVMIVALALCPLLSQTVLAADLGDVNGDRKINSADALMVLQYSTKLIEFNSTQKSAADVNGDKQINSSDALEILKYSIGESSVITTRKPTTTTTTTTTTTKTTVTTKTTTTKPATTSEYWGIVEADPSLRLRSGPGTSNTTLDYVPYKTRIYVTQVSNGWGKITYNGKTGWVSLDYVTREVPTSGTFTVVSYGWGHGVGMSQEGAICYANNGWTYDKILLHYYNSSKTKLEKDPDMPNEVLYGGKTYDIKRYLAGSTYAEIGDYCNVEAIKAQVVAIYTYAKYYGFDVRSSTHAYKEYDYKGTRIETAVNAVLGEFLSYNGKAILSVYCASMGGKNTSAARTWLGNEVEYLAGGRVSPEPESVMKKTYTFTADEIKTLAKENLGVTLNGDPSKWFTNIVHDKSINNNIGYITSMNVGTATVKGEYVRTKLFQYKVRSHCLSIVYNP